MGTHALRASLALWTRRYKYADRRRRAAARRHDGARVRKWTTRMHRCEDEMRHRRYQLRNPLREKAYRIALTLVGVMERGGNNQGPKVAEIIRENGGHGPEPWCGDFVAFCYRHAGSKAVTRAWASVRLLGLAVGVRRVRKPERGDLVRFTFDHVGMFVRRIDATTIETIEGNTGASGAVSDSATGGDGVYRKRRSTSLVADYLRVSR